MGSRSQIYIVYETKERNSDTVDLNVAARYFQTNSGAEMIARATLLLRCLDKEANSYNNLDGGWKKNISESSWKSSSISRVIDNLPNIINNVIYTGKDNLPYVYSTAPSLDIIKESMAYSEKGREQTDVFFNQDNNDGKFIVYVPLEGKIEYAFADENFERPMTAEEYMEWDDALDHAQKSETELGSNFSANCNYLNEYTLMSKEQLCNLLMADYKNMPQKAFTLESFSYKFNVDGKTKIVAIQAVETDSRYAEAAVYDIHDGKLSALSVQQVKLPRGDYQLYSESNLAWAIANEPEMKVIPKNTNHYVQVNMNMLDSSKFDYNYFFDHEGYEFDLNELDQNTNEKDEEFEIV